MKIHPKHLFAPILLLFFLGCASYGARGGGDFLSESELREEVSPGNWKEFGGLHSFLHVNKNQVEFYMVKIDLGDARLRIVSHPASENSGKIGIRKFSSMAGAKIAVNTTPYTKDGQILGIHKSGGRIFSGCRERYSAVKFVKDGGGYSAKIVKNQFEGEFEDCDFAFGGFFTILIEGKIQEFMETKRARCALGVDSNGKTAFILVCPEGVLKRGLTYGECAEILLAAGASDALEFDGGHSTSLLVREMDFLLEESFFGKSAYFGFDY